ncbi:hypothetical protein JD514_11285 [Aeromonas caviae]|uniref:hypothetical protein n=2 Tax=Aeromonas caviae TaxID=648 RepID=UPI00191E3C6E|nr:hypothetical protein [Aeromonas caviae]MBL0497676.1 hypothetical protein [Aeromonas caviae]
MSKMRKKIVVFMYNFPPIGAGRGIAWNKFCSNLSKEYDVSLITIEPSPSDPIYNESKLHDIGTDFNLYRTSPGFLYHKMYPSSQIKKSIKNRSTKTKSTSLKRMIKFIYKKIIRSFIFPDRMIFWNKSAEEEFIKINDGNNVDLIITVGFPFSTHLLGYRLKRKYNVKWIMDYGDPWSFNPSSETVPHYRRWLDRIVESKIIKCSDHIMVTTDTTKVAFESEFKMLPSISVIKQGVDCKLYRDAVSLDANTQSDTLELFYSGLFYKDIRNPECFFIALSKINSLPKNVNIKIAGHMEDYIFDIVDSISLPSFITIEFVGNIGFESVIKYQSNSDGLLFFGNKGDLQVPGKIFEYLASGTPIFSVAHQYDVVSEMIELYQRGETSLNLVEQIKEKFEFFVSKLVLDKSYYSNNDIKQFDWSFISNEVNCIVDSVLGDK